MDRFPIIEMLELTSRYEQLRSSLKGPSHETVCSAHADGMFFHAYRSAASEKVIVKMDLMPVGNRRYSEQLADSALKGSWLIFVIHVF